MFSQHLFHKTHFGAAFDIWSVFIFRKDWALEPLYLQQIHSLIWLEEFEQKLLQFWLEIYTFFDITSAVTLTAKVEPRPPKLFSKK